MGFTVLKNNEGLEIRYTVIGTFDEEDVEEKCSMLKEILGFAYWEDTGGSDKRGAYYAIIGSNKELTEEERDYLFEFDPDGYNYDGEDGEDTPEKLKGLRKVEKSKEKK